MFLLGEGKGYIRQFRLRINDKVPSQVYSSVCVIVCVCVCVGSTWTQR